MADGYTALSLYSGAGGLDWGFRDVGFTILGAVDHDPHAVATYNANFGGGATCGDVLSYRPPQDCAPDVLIGGPPCQGFSVAGRMDLQDRRSHHVLTYMRFVDELRPRAFVMENVKALATSPRWAAIRRELIKRAKRLDYEVRIFVLNAADFGVPQSRERMFLIGVRGAQPTAPVPTTREAPLTAGAALRTLPTFGTPGNDTRCTAKVVPAKDPVLRPTAYRGSLVFNGWGRPLNLSVPAKTLPASMGGNATPIVDQLELAHGAEPWILAYHQHLLGGGDPFASAPERMRRITVEEASVLQSFPLDWKFCGPKGAKFRQIGNSVPPMLGRAVALSVGMSLSAADLRRAEPARPTNPAAGSRKGEREPSLNIRVSAV